MHHSRASHCVPNCTLLTIIACYSKYLAKFERWTFEPLVWEVNADVEDGRDVPLDSQPMHSY